MKHLLKVILGDWSDDGHGKTKTFIIECNLSEQDLNRAYRAGVEIIGFDFKEEVASDYDDATINRGLLKILRSKGVKISFEDYDPDDYEICIDPDDYLEMYMGVCKLGNPNLNYQVRSLPEIRAGGYGLC